MTQEIESKLPDNGKENDENPNRVEAAISGFWKSSQRNLVIITIFATITAAIIVIVLWTSAERFRPLYSRSANYDSSQVLQMLDEESIRYQLSQDDGRS